MKVIYRPHRGSLSDAMEESKEFENLEDMKKYISNKNGYFDAEDIVLSEDSHNDERIGWHNVRAVCTKRFADEDYIKMYGTAQCIGYCATDF